MAPIYWRVSATPFFEDLSDSTNLLSTNQRILRFRQCLSASPDAQAAENTSPQQSYTQPAFQLSPSGLRNSGVVEPSAPPRPDLIFQPKRLGLRSLRSASDSRNVLWVEVCWTLYSPLLSIRLPLHLVLCLPISYAVQIVLGRVFSNMLKTFHQRLRHFFTLNLFKPFQEV